MNISEYKEKFRKRHQARLVREQGWQQVKQSRVRARQSRNRLHHSVQHLLRGTTMTYKNNTNPNRLPAQGGSSWHPDGWVPGDDTIDYDAEYDRRLPAYLDDLSHYEFIGEALGGDSFGARVLQRMIVDLDERMRGNRPRGDLEGDALAAIRDLSERASELAYEPIVRDVDSDEWQAKTQRSSKRKEFA